ncbi:IucA/IucC family C-terminal-domain containing protein [Vibrio japonicus]|uniref:(2Fe-2S)-binding protein n=1 Tax=Vibrio japonicus TaxID=1824638 RepID=A0ABY5LIS6_9VIBR|nr:IucA/IucC family C-terminal-domain containing protein [Vibrio japonicus]UUM31963.1 (2Fe-2S)-binding protein [Vibrio japonicus]
MSEHETDVLSKNEWDTLSRFGLKQQTHAFGPNHLDSRCLLDPQQCLSTLEKIMPELGAPDLKVTASLVIKRIAFLALAPTLYAMSVYNKGLNLSINNSVFDYQLDNRFWQNGMPLKNTTVRLASGERQKWRDEVLHHVFAEHLTRLVEQFYDVTGVSQRILWENIAVRVFSIYERRILPDVTCALKETAEEDLAFLVDADTHHIFAMKENPLTRFYRKKTLFGEPPEPIRMRRTCCYYYQATTPEVYCSNCPLLLKSRE